MRYRIWTQEDGDLDGGLVELWTEIGDDGFVTREIGFDENGHVAHKMPSNRFRHGTYGLFDLAPVELTSTEDQLTAEEFEARWQDSES